MIVDLQRQVKTETGALSRFALNFHMPTVGLYDSAHQPEAQSQPGLGTALVTSIQTVPNVGKVFLGYSRTGILDCHHCLSILPAGCDSNHSSRLSIFDGIVKEICNDLADPVQVYRDGGLV